MTDLQESEILGVCQLLNCAANPRQYLYQKSKTVKLDIVVNIVNKIFNTYNTSDMEEPTLQLQNEGVVQQNDENTENVNETNNLKKPITEIIQTVLGDYITCHVCKVKLRKTCILNHFSSDYHKYSMEIFNEVLARYRNATAEPVPDFDDQWKMSSNYCDVCNLELMDNENDEHYISEIHKINENYVQSTMKLAHAYVFDSKVCNQIVEDDSEEAEKKQTDETIHKILGFIKQYFVHIDGNKMHCRVCGIHFHAYNDVLAHVKIDHQVVLSSDNVVSSIKINDELKIESYKQISIVTVKNVVLVIASDAWQGLSGNTCLLCNNKEFNDKVEHIQNEAHVHRLFVASLVDANGMRELKRSRFNCLVCQKIIAADKYYNHLKSIDHKINYGEAVNKSCYNTVVKHEKYYHCSSCGFDVADIYKERHESGPRHFFNLYFIKTIKVDTGNSDLLGNARCRKYKVQLNEKEPDVLNIIETATKKTKNKGKSSVSNLSYTCETCDCQVPISAKDQHESGTRHKKKIQNKIKDSKIKLHRSKSPDNDNDRTRSESRKNNTKSKFSTKKKKTKPNVPEYLQQWSNILQREEQCQTDLNISNDKSYISCPDDEEQVIDNLESSLIIEEMDSKINDNPAYSYMWKSLFQDDQVEQEDEHGKCFNSTGIEFDNLTINESNLLEARNCFKISLKPNARKNNAPINMFVNSNVFRKYEKRETDAKSFGHACNQSFNLNIEESELIDVTDEFSITLGPGVPIIGGSFNVYKSKPNDVNEDSVYFCIVKSESISSEIPNVANYLNSTSNESICGSSEVCKTGDKDINIPNVDTQQTDQICEETTHNNKENLSYLVKLDNQQPCQIMQNETAKDDLKNDDLETTDIQIQSVMIDEDVDKGLNVSGTATESTSINKVNNDPSTIQPLEATLPQDIDSSNKSDTHLSSDFQNIALSSTTNSNDDKDMSSNNGAKSSSFKSDEEDDTKMKFNNDLISTNISDDISDESEELTKASFADTGVKVYQVLNKIFGKGDILNENNINYATELSKYKEASKVGTKCKACNIIVKKTELSAHSKSQQHIKTLNRSLQRNNAVSPNSDTVTIDVDDKVFNVNFGNYNGLFITPGNKVWCTFCQCHAVTVDHVYDERHIETLKKYVISSKDCLRNIDVGFAHCLLCNLLIQTGDNHTKTDSHIANLLKSIRTR